MTKSNFLSDIPKQYRDPASARVAIIPVPYDGTSTWGKGADKGPAAIIEASATVENYDIESDSEPYKVGILTDKPILEKSSPEKMVEAVEKRVGGHLANGKFPIVIGGEHSVSIGAIKAQAKKHKKLTVLQLDAHSDLRDEYHGSKCNHACVMARAQDLCPTVQVGIRSMDVSEKRAIDKVRTFFAEDIHDKKGWIDKVVSLLKGNVYVTIDLDVFDPSIMPSTGTPEPGGLGWYEVLDLMRLVFRKTNVTGFDVVEMCPNPANKAPDFLAAKLIYKLISYKFGK
ncbi:MAG: agmatinase [Sedimentisphaerales bacterium]|nr:agmatinase [Sedimentisphaerales bacterium]